MVGTIVDVFATPSCFTTLPVRVHEHEKDIARCEDTILDVFRNLSLRIKIRPHSKGPNGNFFAFCYPDGLTERVSLNAEIIEALWIYDGTYLMDGGANFVKSFLCSISSVLKKHMFESFWI